MAEIHTLARAIIDTYEVEEDKGRNSYNVCRHCSAWVYWDVPFPSEKHASNCPVLLAMKVLNA